MKKQSAILTVVIAFLIISIAAVPATASAQSTVTLTVNTQYADGNSLTGMYTILRQNGSVVATGFSPHSFNLVSGQAYTISVGDYGGSTFYEWDNGSTTRVRPITITSSTTVTALYINDANPPPSSPPPPPPPGEAELTVHTQYANANPLTGMWTTLRQGGASGTIVGTGFSPVTFTVDTGTQYTVTTSDYQQITFYQWDNGSTTRARSVNISSDTTITSLYVSPTNPPPSGVPTAQPVSASVAQNSKTGVSIALQGSDPAGQPLTYYVVSKPSKGAVSLADDNVVVYTPYDWENGSDSFTYAVHNGDQASSPATVSINITGTASKTTSRIVVITEFEDGRSHTGILTTLSQGGTTINSGFSHIHFDVNNGQNYTVTVSSGSSPFLRWQDTGSTNPSRTINISQDTAIIAIHGPP